MRRKDSGSGPVTALLFMAILALLFGAGFTALGAAAGDERSDAQHAADAAALGGARGILDAASDSLQDGFTKPSQIVDLLGGGTCLQDGRIKAAELASANEATLTSYCWNVFRDQVTVAVRMNATNVTGPVAVAEAEAATTFDASSCQLDPRFEQPSPTPTTQATPEPTESPAASPPPAGPVVTSIDCGFGPLAVTFHPGDLRFTFDDLTPALDDLKPRLTA